MSRRLPRTARPWGVLAAVGCIAVLVTLLVAPSQRPAGPARHTPPVPATLAADIAVVHAAEASAQALARAPGMPTCAPPALPAPTYPPGHTYGIPFLAA